MCSGHLAAYDIRESQRTQNMPIRTSKQALADAAMLLGCPRDEARTYFRSIQQEAGAAIPYATIVAAMRDGDPGNRAAVARRARELLRERDRA
jgi:hypothetical protein